jgi:RHS repeat-associated protein
VFSSGVEFSEHGKTTQSRHRQIITTLIDPLGRPYTVTDQDGGTSTTTYSQNDALKVLTPAPSGENAKQVQKQYDGLGRVTSICKISSTVSGNVLCGQNTNTSATGVLTTKSYNLANGGTIVSSFRGSESRSTTYDALNRVLSTSTPEGGTTTYTYDSYPSGECDGWTSQPGQLMVVSRANGSNTCYVHNDPLGRLTRTCGTSGTCQAFRYDNSPGVTGTRPPGIVTNNSLGRLVEAETDNGSAWPPNSSSMLTDEWFSYDADGRVTDIWELTPHSGSGNYYHSTVTYNPNGTVNTLQLVNPSLYSLTYGIDGEGRWNTLTVGASQNIVTSTTYNAASQPTEIALTSNDQDDYTYDANSGRMTGWTFDVGSASESGTLTWNPNATLEQLVLSDGFNSGGSQTCDYNPSLATGTGYDDLGRLVGVTCGSVWAQTFSYDQYDNITKSGSLTWNPGYNTNNQYTLSGMSYDASGNLLTDTFHTYTWDGYNKLLSVDSSACGSNGECITYDALGRAVEISKGGSYTEIWYTPLGKTAYMSGSTINYAYVPAPGGGTAYIGGNAGSVLYMHKDWLGNSRIISSINNHDVLTDQAYAPYGEVYASFGESNSAFQMFTGDSQDVVATGDCCFDTPNRELSANQGRWLSPDPAGAGWNLYAYSTNPNSAIDPSGLETQYCWLNNHAATGGCVGGHGGDPSGGDINPPGNTTDNPADPDSPTPASGTVGGDGSNGSDSNNGSGSATSTPFYVDTDGNTWVWNGQDWDMQLTDFAYAVFSDPALQIAANAMNNPATYVDWFGGSALLGVGGLLLPDAAEAVADYTYDNPEVISNIVDFVSSFDPNPAVPLTVTFGGLAGWVESGGLDDLVDAMINNGSQMLNYVQTVGQQQGSKTP